MDKKEEPKEAETRKRFRGPSGHVQPAGARSEEEVEEFFAIIRRMHVAARMMSGTGKPSSQAAVERKTATMDWLPTFSPEDFGKAEQGPDGESGNLGSSAEERATAAVTKDNKEIGLGRSGGAVSLDLNAEPESEGVLR